MIRTLCIDPLLERLKSLISARGQDLSSPFTLTVPDARGSAVVANGSADSRQCSCSERTCFFCTDLAI